MTQVHLFISGNVQGIGYRAFVKSNAKQLGLTGWARNTEDGGVEVVLQSSASSDQEGKKAIEQMIELCRTGPFMAEVKQLGFEWEDADEEFDSFTIS